MRLTHPVFTETPDMTAFRGTRGEHLSIHILEPDVIRICHRPNGVSRMDRTWSIIDRNGQVPLIGRQRDDLTSFSKSGYDAVSTGNWIGITTQILTIQIDLEKAAIDWFNQSGQIFAADVPLRAYAYDRSGTAIFHYMQRRPDDHYYGFGEISGPLEKTGRHIILKNVDAFGYDARRTTPLYKHIPFYITYVADLNVAYGLFYDNLSTTTFDLGSEVDAVWGNYRYYRAEGGDLDYYLIYGPTIGEVVEKFTQLTGRPMLPPRWTLGYLGSTMSYTEAEDAQEQLKAFVFACNLHDIPADMFHLSSGYSVGDDGQRYVFTWNRNRIPNPAQMTKQFHDANMQVAANVKPYLLKSHPYYEDVSSLGGFIKNAETADPELAYFWSGALYESGEGSYIDFTSYAGYNWWKHQLKAQLLDFGVNVPWNDNNEFEVWDDLAECNGFGDPLAMGLARPLQTLLMARASHEAALENSPGLRPFVLTRAGTVGIQRYAQTWSGDNTTSWETLRYNIPMGLGLSLSGVPNTGHDVGGFAGPSPDPDLLVRWVQTGIFHPRFAIHSWSTDGVPTEPWMYPDVLPLIRDAIHLRYRLIPYLYTLFFEAAEKGMPIMRPLVYDFAHDPACRTASFEWMLGPNLLVAPVLDAGAMQREVYLPSGKNWFAFDTGAYFEGGQTIVLDTPLGRVPLFVPEGGMIPMRPTAGDDQSRHVFVFPRHGTSTFTLIEDDGVSFGYQEGQYERVLLSVRADQDTLACSALMTTGRYPLPYSDVAFIFPAGEARTAKKPYLDCWFDEAGQYHIRVEVTGKRKHESDTKKSAGLDGGLSDA